MALVWWQLSDLHWPVEPQAERLRFIDRLLAALSSASVRDLGPPDFVAFTGDVSGAGREEEFSSVTEHVLEPLRGVLGPDVPILVVPGNHDMERAQADNLSHDRICRMSSPTQVDAFLADERSHRAFRTPFESFDKFSQAVSPDVDRVPFGWSYDLRTGTRQVQVCGVDTAWSSYYNFLATGDDDERRLLLGQAQLAKANDDADLRVLLMHHPLSWTNPAVTSRVEASLQQQFNLVLHGHVHTVHDLGLVVSPRSRTCFVPSAVLYDKPYEDSIEFARAFAVGRVDDDLNCEVRYFRYSDPFGSKFVPYTDLYPEGEDHFGVSLKPGVSRATPRTGERRDLEGRLRPERLNGPEAAVVRRDLGTVPAGHEASERLVRLFAEMAMALIGDHPVVIDGAEDSTLMAYLIAEAGLLVAARNPERPYGHRTFDDDLLDGVRGLRSRFPSVGDDDFEALLRMLAGASVADAAIFLDVPAGSWPVCMSFALFWGIAQVVLLLDRPSAGPIPADVGEEHLVDGRILDVRRVPPDATATIRLSTRTRSEFHQIAENRHLIEQYLHEVEDLWRRAALIAPPIALRLSFPQWRQRSLESHRLQVDPRPITRLLMGQALYGDRAHVWLRELIQNAIDATEMRRSLLVEPDYVPSIDVLRVDGRRVTIADNGMGMTYQHVVAYLATLGRSGWRAIETTDAAPDAAYFGRFGIGFASVFNNSAEVRIATRRPSTRSIDGLSVSFTSPERPFFIEPAVASEGTVIDVHLEELLSEEGFADAMGDLFVYSPPNVSLPEGTGLPARLDAVTLFGADDLRPRVSSVVQTEAGSGALAVRMELFDRPKGTNRRVLTNAAAVPGTQLSVSTSGVRLFDQTALLVDRSGLAFKDLGSWDERRERSLGFDNCHVIFDFQRESAPVLPSRNGLVMTPDMQRELKALVHDQFLSLFPQLVRASAGSNDQEAMRQGFLSSLSSVLRAGAYWEVLPLVHADPDVTAGLGAYYLDLCPVMVRNSDGGEDLLALGSVDPSSCTVAVTESASLSSAFTVYARANELRQWIVLSTTREAALLEEVWPFDAELSLYTEESQLYQHHRQILPEVRSMAIVELLRGDYALSDGGLFEDALYVRLPSDVASVPRHVGVNKRRNEMPLGATPRVMLNSRHPVIEALEAHLVGVPADRPGLERWLEGLCEGVIEDKSKRAPAARWTTLAEQLLALTGIDVRRMTAADLRLT